MCVWVCWRAEVLCFENVCACACERELSVGNPAAAAKVSQQWCNWSLSMCLSLSLSLSLYHWPSLASPAPQKVREAVGGKSRLSPPLSSPLSAVLCLPRPRCLVLPRARSRVLAQFMDLSDDVLASHNCALWGFFGPRVSSFCVSLRREDPCSCEGLHD